MITENTSSGPVCEFWHGTGSAWMPPGRIFASHDSPYGLAFGA